MRVDAAAAGDADKTGNADDAGNADKADKADKTDDAGNADKADDASSADKTDDASNAGNPLTSHASAAELLSARGLVPDRFQQQAFDAIDRTNSVVVAAPTSSGKTLVAEYAAFRNLAARRKVAYTSPTKALSNQKMRDLRTLFGDEVGLLTGDNVIRPNAPTVVMTTEVLRNMIYVNATMLDDLGLVVLDEVHYLQDPYRGSVWEEVIIGLPAHVRLVCLSATVTNADELAAWISSVREHCEVVVETERPVELHEHFLVYDKTRHQIHDFPTLRGNQPNRDVLRFLSQGSGGAAGQSRGGRPGQYRSSSRRDDAQGGPRPARPRHIEILEHLESDDRLPAIIFVFSRQGCDDAVNNCLAHGVDLIDPMAQSRIAEIAAQHVTGIDAADLPTLGYDHWLDGLMTGVAAHHAGMVPSFKEAVEDCFSAGLLAAVFATETLALGLNMPARSVVVEQLSRFRGEGFVMLTSGEYTQLTGRAGRRGIDTVGHAYTLWSPYDSYEQTAQLVASKDFELNSSFRPTYNMATNLIDTYADRGAAIGVLSRSFAQFRANTRVPEWSEELVGRAEELKLARRRLRQLTGPGGSRPAKGHHAHGRDRSGRTQTGRRGRESRKVTDARRELEMCERRVRVYENRIALADDGLAKTFDSITLLLEEFGCVDGWQLTVSGRQLSRIFHEADLLVTLALRDGMFDDLLPAELAGLVSCFTYEHRSRIDPPPPSFPSTAMRDAAQAIASSKQQLNQRERALGLAETGSGDSAFFGCAYAWAEGAALEEILTGNELGRSGSRGPSGSRRPSGPSGSRRPSGSNGSSGSLGAQMSPGDFVRQIRQLADLLRQIATVTKVASTRRSASDAVTAIERGVVAATTGVNNEYS